MVVLLSVVMFCMNSVVMFCMNAAAVMGLVFYMRGFVDFLVRQLLVNRLITPRVLCLVPL